MTDFFSNFPALASEPWKHEMRHFFLVVQGVGQWRKFSNGSAKLHICCRSCSTYFVAIDHKKSPLTMVLFVMSPRSAFLSRLREIPHVVGQEVVADAAPIASADEIHVSEDFASL